MPIWWFRSAIPRPRRVDGRTVAVVALLVPLLPTPMAQIGADARPNGSVFPNHFWGGRSRHGTRCHGCARKARGRRNRFGRADRWTVRGTSKVSCGRADMKRLTNSHLLKVRNDAHYAADIAGQIDSPTSRAGSAHPADGSGQTYQDAITVTMPACRRLTMRIPTRTTISPGICSNTSLRRGDRCGKDSARLLINGASRTTFGNHDPQTPTPRQ